MITLRNITAKQNQSTLLIYKSPGTAPKSQCVGVTDNVKDASAEGVPEKILEEVNRIYELEKELHGLGRIKPGHSNCKPLKTFSDNTKLHFAILSRLLRLAKQRKENNLGTKSYSIAPLCDDVKKSFVEYHKSSLRLYFISVIRGDAPQRLKTPKVLRVLNRMMIRGAVDL
jgi:hypothetical protein